MRGSVTLKIDKRIQEAVSGDILVFNSFEVHESISLSPENEYYVFVIPPEYFLTEKAADNFVYDSIIKDDADCISHIKKAMALVDNPRTGSQFLLNAEIFNFLFAAAQKHGHKSSSQIYEMETALIIEDIKERIARCYAEPININLLANAFCISVSYLQHTFKAQTGHSIIDYMNRTRINNAEKLLLETDLHISEISEKVGFPDYNYFSRVFRKYKNLTPSEYRKNTKTGLQTPETESVLSPAEDKFS